MEITSLSMPILGVHFRIFMALLLAVQASARNVLVSLWYCTFSYSAVFDSLPGQDSNENDEFGGTFDVHDIGSNPPPIYYVLYLHRLSLLESVCLLSACLSVCLSVCPALRPTGLVLG